MEFRDALAEQDVTIAGCDGGLVGPLPNGTEVLFRCRSRVIYALSSGGRTLFHGYQRLRDPTERFTRGDDGYGPAELPLRQMRLAASRAAAEAAYDALPGAARPEGLPARARDAGPGLLALAPGEAASADAGSAGGPAETLPQPAAPPQLLRLVTPAALGDIEVSHGSVARAEGASADSPSLAWEWRLDPGAIPQVSRITLARRADCAVDVSPALIAQSSGDIAFPCGPRRVLPLADFRPASGPACRRLRDETFECILKANERDVQMFSESWAPTRAVLAPSGFLEIDRGSLRPRIPLVSAAAASKANVGRCAAPLVSARLVGYCADGGERCMPAGAPPAEERGADPPEGGLFIPDETGSPEPEPEPEPAGLPLAGIADRPFAGPSLAEAGWSDDEALPDSAAVELIGPDGTAVPTLVPFDGAEIEILAALGLEMPTRRLPLLARLSEESRYSLDRDLRFFADGNCTVPFEDVPPKLLYFPDTPDPEVPVCGHYQAYDGGSPASVCSPLGVDAAGARAVAEVDIVNCGDKRLVVLVVENGSFSNQIGESVVRAVRGLATALREAEACLPVDIAVSRGTDREVLLRAEQIRMSPDPEALWRERARFKFITPTSQPFQDFTWIEQEWGDALGGLVVVLDATRPAPSSRLDAPAAMAWAAIGHFRWVLNTAGGSGCDKYQSLLRMENCEGIDDSFSAERLRAVVEKGLAEIGAGQ
ncbi:hypothetical protein LNKW23_10700 [Paralimibaculum aggregatum]|uniref:Uncharacterized protein n=1 Tax=Paralimibaculum aggregatum TaxID=3036245 RepID=A0ABQ6LET5_9RHOB|nr:hypothetical protein [Limibaculum sp. NKW23]GMG81857.1 hypothetical protein LNKW23_10700 [Limibaculum sp. NKW23]